MHPSPASTPPWLARLARPWLVASSLGLSLGVALLYLGSLDVADYLGDSQIHAAAYEPTRFAPLVQDPFAPAATLSAPPDGANAMEPLSSSIPDAAR